VSDEPARRSVRLRVRGRVQGVGFRYFTLRRARELGLGGWVRNLPDGGVEVEAWGGEPAIDRLRAALAQGPAGARVTAVEVVEAGVGKAPPAEGAPGFRIID
jgi:acylphosphatase